MISLAAGDLQRDLFYDEVHDDRWTGLRDLLRPAPGARHRDDRGAGPMCTTMDGNEAVAAVAYQLSEVVAIYPITPSSPMGEWADQWAAEGQAESVGQRAARWWRCRARAGRPGRVHGALQGGALFDDVHGVAGPAADDPQHVQDRRRTDVGGLSRRRPLAGGAGAVDLRRPQRRDGRPRHRLRACWPPTRCRRRPTSPWSPTPPRWNRASPSSTSSTASAPPTR